MHSFLDIRTLSLISGVMALAIFICMLFVAVRHKTYPGFLIWTAAALAYSLGFILLSLRHIMPDAGTVVAANGLIGLASVLLYRGLRSFAGAPQRNRLDIAAMAALVLLFVYFTQLRPDVCVRIFILSLFQAVYYLAAVRLIAGPVRELLGNTNYLLLFSFLSAGLWLIMRAILTLLWRGHIPDFMTAGSLQGFSFVVFLTCYVMTIVGLISINSKRTENDLTSAKREIESLQDFLPICANCKKIRDDQGYWQQVESYISEYTGAELTHGICPECMKKLYPQLGNSNAQTAPDQTPPKSGQGECPEPK